MLIVLPVVSSNLFFFRITLGEGWYKNNNMIEKVPINSLELLFFFEFITSTIISSIFYYSFWKKNSDAADAALSDSTPPTRGILTS